jgi:predicted small secreted protein
MTFEDLSIQADYLNFSFTASGNSTDKSCVQKGNMTGIVKKDDIPIYDYKTASQNRILKGASKTFSITGDCKGTFSITDSPAAKTTWNGKIVYAVGTTEIVTLNNCALGVSDTQTSINYYDMNFMPLAKISSRGTYSEYVSTSQLNFVKVGDSGTLGTWYTWDNSNKSHLGNFDVMSYTVEPDTATSVIVNTLDHSVLDTNQNDNNTQLRFRLTSAGDLEWVSVTIDFPATKGRLVFQ